MKQQIGVAVLALVVAFGCWHDPRPAAAEVPGPTVPLERGRPHHTVWEGRYMCAQGETALRLTLDTEPDGQTIGMFDFGPHPGNPHLPSGSYRMRGKITMREGGAFELVLVPDQWIAQPAGYLMVGLTATSNRERTELNGRITHETCSWVRVARVS
jgi:hypothetical protein